MQWMGPKAVRMNRALSASAALARVFSRLKQQQQQKQRQQQK